MPRNTPWFSAYLRQTREKLGWSQQQVHDAGGPYRQAQAEMEKSGDEESGEESVLRTVYLEAFDRVYGWPSSYTQALAELGEYVEDPERALPDSLRGSERDEAVTAWSYRGHESPPVNYRTFSGFYEKPSVNNRSSACVGFDANTGEPVFVDGPILTNIAFDHLYPMIFARHGVTTIDVNVTTKELREKLTQFTYEGVPGGAPRDFLKSYRIGVAEQGLGEPIILDPLSEITTLTEAKRFAADLLAIRKDVRTSSVRAGFTFLAIAAFGEDNLLSLTQLERTVGNPFSKWGFGTFWEGFYDPAKAGPDLGRPDQAACDLLAGVLAARDATMEIQIGDRRECQRQPIYDLPKVMTPEQLSCGAQGPALIFYDSTVIPELPVVQSFMRPTEALTFYDVKFTVEGRQTGKVGVHGGIRGNLSPQFGTYPYHRVGIAVDSDDHRIVERQDPYELSTLTNYVAGKLGGQAIYCYGHRAQRVWIPRQ